MYLSNRAAQRNNEIPVAEPKGDRDRRIICLYPVSPIKAIS